MADPKAGLEDPGAEERARPRPWQRVGARTSIFLLAILTVLFVASTVVAVVLWNKGETLDERERERARAANVASQFALRMDNVDGSKFDAYAKGVNELLTTKAKSKNAKVFEAVAQSYEAAKVKGTGKVLLTAVGDADEDSATVLVVHDADVTSTQGDVERHYRWSVEVVKVNGEWLVDDFRPVS